MGKKCIKYLRIAVNLESEIIILLLHPSISKILIISVLHRCLLHTQIGCYPFVVDIIEPHNERKSVECVEGDFLRTVLWPLLGNG